MIFRSSRLGQIEIHDTEIIQFPEGLYGFETQKRFCLLPFDTTIDCPLKWLQSLDNPDLAFVVTDPFLYVPDYRVVLSPEEQRLFHASPADTLVTLVIVRVPEDYTKMTANLVAPLVVNPQKMIGRQVVLSNPEYDTRHYLLPEEVRAGQTPVA